MFFSTGAELQAALDALPASKKGSFTAFDQFFYSQEYMSAYTGPLSPIEHFVQIGAARGFKPNATLDPVFYQNEYPQDLANQGFDAADLLYHFMQFGLDEGRIPNATFRTFDGSAYLADNPDVAAYVNANLDQFQGSTSNGAIAHYVKFGAFEGRTANGVGDQDFTLTVGSPTISEGNSGSKTMTFTLALDREPGEAVTVNYQTQGSGTATAGDDFTAAAGAVTFAAGQTAASVSVTILGDTDFEPDETVAVSFSGSRLASSVTASGTITNDDVDPSTVAQVFTLTTGNDSIPGLIGSNGTAGSGGDDTINGVVQNSGNNGSSDQSTLNSGDTLDTGEGEDALNVRVVSLTGQATVVPVLSSVDKVSATNVDSSGHNAAINLVSSSGTSTVEFRNTVAASNTTFLNAAEGTVIALDNADATDGHKVNFGSAAGRSGNSDAVSISISNGSGSSQAAASIQLVGTDGSSTDSSFETANITIAGSSSYLNAQQAFSAITTLNVMGEASGEGLDYGLHLMQDGDFASLMSIDASAMSGAGLNLDARGSNATGLSFLGSDADDRVVLANTTINNAASLAGGGGKDILASTSFNLTAAVVNAASGFEVLEAAQSTGSLQADSFTSIHEFVFSGGEHNGRVNITGVESNDRFVFASDQGQGDEAVRFTAANVGNSVLFEMRASSETDGEVRIYAQTNSGNDVAAIGFQNGISSVTIDSTGENAKANLIEAVDTGTYNFYALNNENGLANFTITGSQALTIAAREGVELSSSTKTLGFSNSANVNASEFTGVLRIAGSNSSDVISGGSGNDIIYGLSGNDTLTGNGGADQFRMVGTGGSDILKDFVKGTDKVGFNNVNFANTTATSAGATLSADDYVSNRSGITSIGASDDAKVIELQSALSQSQIQTDLGAAVEAYVLVFNSSNGKGQLWFDNDWSNDDSRSLVATFDDVVDLVGLVGFANTDFVEFVA